MSKFKIGDRFKLVKSGIPSLDKLFFDTHFGKMFTVASFDVVDDKYGQIYCADRDINAVEAVMLHEDFLNTPLIKALEEE